MPLETKKLTWAERIQVQRSMARDFPKAERKPLWLYLWLWLSGVYEGYGYYEDGKRAGHMLFCKAAGYTLLDFYAIEPEYRSKGYGSAFFQAVCGQMPGLLLEVEDPAFAADAADREIRARRIGFYERNGCAMTSLRGEVFGAHYCIMAGPGAALPPGGALEPLQALYLHIFGKRQVRKHIRLEEAV